MADTLPKVSRAVLRLINPGNRAECEWCGNVIGFRARERRKQYICNIYAHGAWTRVEHYHEDCYLSAGKTYRFIEDGLNKRGN